MNDRLQPMADCIKVQNAYLSYHLVRRTLDRAGVHVNGHLKPQMTPRFASSEGFKRALKALEKANDMFMDRFKESVMKLVETLDTSDSQLHAEFLKAAGQVVDEIRWGRIASLFFLTSLLAERLVHEGQGAKIESLVMWLAQFLNDHVSSWIEQKGGWIAIADALTTETNHLPKKAPSKAAEVKGSSWFTLAALGVGAFVIGSLAIK